MPLNIKQIIIERTTVFIFTDNPERDILKLKKAYDDRCDIEFKFPLGYEEPVLVKYTFLEKEYPCISLWFDNEDVPDVFNKYVFNN